MYLIRSLEKKIIAGVIIGFLSSIVAVTTNVQAFGFSPGAIDIGYVLPSAKLPIVGRVSKRSVEKVTHFSLRAIGNGSEAFWQGKTIQGSFDSATNKNQQINFAVGGLAPGEYNPTILVEALYISSTIRNGSQSLASIQVPVHFVVTTTPVAMFDRTFFMIHPRSSTTTCVDTIVDNKGTLDITVLGFSLVDTNTGTDIPMLFTDPITVAAKHRERIAQCGMHDAYTVSASSTVRWFWDTQVGRLPFSGQVKFQESIKNIPQITTSKKKKYDILHSTGLLVAGSVSVVGGIFIFIRTLKRRKT